MSLVTHRALARRYDASHHAGVEYVAMYWHFLDAVWLVLYATLMIGALGPGASDHVNLGVSGKMG
jgi:cytochrome c oxidase subunit 3